MRKPEDQLTVDNSRELLSEALGISPERRAEIQKKIEEVCKEENEKDTFSHSAIIARVWNEFEVPGECAYGLYILQHAEESVSIHSLFKLPESVEA